MITTIHSKNGQKNHIFSCFFGLLIVHCTDDQIIVNLATLQVRQTRISPLLCDDWLQLLKRHTTAFCCQT